LILYTSWGPMLTAIEFISFVDKILNWGTIDCNEVDNELNSPILLASLQSNMDLVKILHKYKANINVMNKKGETPLIF